MRIGLSFPQNEIGNDPIAIRDFVQTAEGLGYGFVTFIDHVLQTRAPKGPPMAALYTRDKPFHEVFTLAAYLAGLTKSIVLSPAVLVLPQRQTAVVAKQAAEVDVLSGGRFRLGIGIGWSEAEYDAVGESFRTRGRRVEEQVAVLRQLWCNETITFKGREHEIEDCGLNPLPVQRPIPVWFGGAADAALARLGRLAAGATEITFRTQGLGAIGNHLDALRRFALTAKAA
jgi:probable F420-dependent oxidoreductase